MNTASFPTPAIFNWLQAQGNIDTDEMYHIFNMGIGFTLVVAPEDEAAVHEILKNANVDAYTIGHIAEEDSAIRLTEAK